MASNKKNQTKDAPQTDNLNENDSHMVDPIAFGHILMNVYQKSQPLMQDFFENLDYDVSDTSIDPLNIREAYTDFFNTVLSNPQQLIDAQVSFWTNWVELWQQTTERFLEGKTVSTDLYEPEAGDRRFRSPLWHESAVFDFIKQSYLLTSSSIKDLVHNTEGMDKAAKQKVEFYTKQYLDALAPTNFLVTNPEVIQETVASNGQNLVNGLENLIEDLKRGQGTLKISTTNIMLLRMLYQNFFN